ncbi:DUF3216 domain-containing protein [Pyrococcus sp. ST04]|uniref:DUF3216 domain-containing protein n=1 Tax=Pyrococcus sp. ST04 TaxID=1183377 RepID=UPI000650019F|nr:DUF3216 domain-containing protein [Pyrococcus sp. ST04]
MDLVEEVKKLCKELNENSLVEAIDRFILLNKGIEKTRGEHFAKAGIYGFLEGILTTLKLKYNNPKVNSLLEIVREARSREEVYLRKAKPPIAEGQ